MDDEMKHEVAAELKRMWAGGALPSALARALTSRGLGGGPIIRVMMQAFDLPLPYINAITAWLSHQDDERLDRFLLPRMPGRSEPGQIDSGERES